MLRIAELIKRVVIGNDEEEDAVKLAEEFSETLSFSFK